MSCNKHINLWEIHFAGVASIWRSGPSCLRHRYRRFTPTIRFQIINECFFFQLVWKGGAYCCEFYNSAPFRELLVLHKITKTLDVPRMSHILEVKSNSSIKVFVYFKFILKFHLRWHPAHQLEGKSTGILYVWLLSNQRQIWASLCHATIIATP